MLFGDLVEAGAKQVNEAQGPAGGGFGWHGVHARRSRGLIEPRTCSMFGCGRRPGGSAAAEVAPATRQRPGARRHGSSHAARGSRHSDGVRVGPRRGRVPRAVRGTHSWHTAPDFGRFWRPAQRRRSGMRKGRGSAVQRGSAALPVTVRQVVSLTALRSGRKVKSHAAARVAGDSCAERVRSHGVARADALSLGPSERIMNRNRWLQESHVLQAAAAPAWSNDCPFSSNPAVSRWSNRCARTAPLRRSRSPTLRSCSSSEAGVTPALRARSQRHECRRRLVHTGVAASPLCR